MPAEARQVLDCGLPAREHVHEREVVLRQHLAVVHRQPRLGPVVHVGREREPAVVVEPELVAHAHARRPLRGERRLVVGAVALDGHTARPADRVGELRVVGVEIAELALQGQAVDRHPQQLDLGAPDVERGGVQHREAERRDRGVGIDHLGDARLEVGVVAVEERTIQPQAALRQRVLAADLVGPHVLRVVGARLAGRVGAAVETAALEAAAGARVEQRVVRQLVVEPEARRQRVPALVVRVLERADQRGQVGEGRGGAEVVLALVRVAQAERAGELVAELPGGLPEGGVAVGVEVVVDGPQERERQRAEHEEVVRVRLLVRGDALVEVVEAEHGVQAPAVVEQELEFLGQLVLVHAHEHVAELPLAGVDVDVVVHVEVAIAGDGLEAPVVGHVPADGERDAAVVEVLSLVAGERRARLELPVAGRRGLQHVHAAREVDLQQRRLGPAEVERVALPRVVERQAHLHGVARLEVQDGARCRRVDIVVLAARWSCPRRCRRGSSRARRCSHRNCP